MYIVIDVGGTNIRISSSSNLENVKFDNIEKLKVFHDFEVDYNQIVKTIKEISNGNIEAIGVGTPGRYNEEKKKILDESPNLPDWIEKPFVSQLSEEFNCPVFADNDAVVASLSDDFQEQVNGGNFIYITWGTGIGGAVVRNENGKVVSEMITRETGLNDWESGCSGKKIEEKFGRPAQELNEDEWSQIMDAFTCELLKLSDKFNEKNVVIGGGITVKQKDRLQKISKSLAEKGVNLKLSNLDDDTGLYGAIALIKNKL